MKTRIKELRKNNKVSQDKLALAVGVTRQTIISLEKEKYVASLVLAYKIAKYFRLSIEDVFDFSEVEDIEYGKFKKKIQKRRILVTIIFILQSLMTVFFSKLKGFEFIMGVMCAVSLLALFQIFQYSKALKDEKKMKQMYILENDERKLMIKKDAFQSTFQIGIILFILAIALTIDYHEMIAKTLICVLYGFLVLLAGFKIYYSRKY